jgi:ribonucleotide monophosphatase NagD (HAD superfamily)
MSAPLRYSTKKTPTIIGKPHKHMMETIMAAYVLRSLAMAPLTWSLQTPL